MIKRIFLCLGFVFIACYANKTNFPEILPEDPVLSNEITACTIGEVPKKEVLPFLHKRSSFIALSGRANHSMQDLLVTPGAKTVIEGKFSYGPFSKDLEDETIEVYLAICTGWILLGKKTTDNDGRIRLSLRAPMKIGFYPIRLQVMGDASYATGTLAVFPFGTRLSVFDLDGTLTTGDREIFKDVRNDLFSSLGVVDYFPKIYPGASELTQATHRLGYLNVYLSGRPYWLFGITRDWLSFIGIAPGILHLTDSNRQALPRPESVGVFKRDFLKKLQEDGFQIDLAFGNASTDIYAYQEAGILPQNTFIIGKYAGENGTQHIKDSWEEIVKQFEARTPLVPLEK